MAAVRSRLLHHIAASHRQYRAVPTTVLASLPLLACGVVWWLTAGLRPRRTRPGAERFVPYTKYMLIAAAGVLDRVGDAAHDDREPRRAGRDGRRAPPVPERARRHERQEHRGEPHDPDDVPVVPDLSARQQATVVPWARTGTLIQARHVRARGGGRRSSTASTATSSKRSCASDSASTRWLAVLTCIVGVTIIDCSSDGRRVTR